jgi:hypothetical protein
MEKMLISIGCGATGNVGAPAHPDNNATRLRLRKLREMHAKRADTGWGCNGVLQIGEGRKGEGGRIIPLVSGKQQLSQNFPDLMVNFMGILHFFTYFYFPQIPHWGHLA